LHIYQFKAAFFVIVGIVIDYWVVGCCKVDSADLHLSMDVVVITASITTVFVVTMEHYFTTPQINPVNLANSTTIPKAYFT